MALTEQPRLLLEGLSAGDRREVDVLMPYYNTGLFIRDQIESIRRQTFGNFRLTVLDNGSQPVDAKIVHDLLANMDNARLFRVDANVGVLNAFEFLLGTVTAPYFALSDSDDIWDADKLQVSLDALRPGGHDLVYTDLRMADRDCREFYPSKWDYSNTPPIQGTCPLQFVLKNPVSGCTIVGCSRLISEALPFPAGIPMHDRWLAIVAALGQGVGFVNRPTMFYRQHGANDTGGLGFGFSALRERMRRNGGDAAVYTTRRIDTRKVLLRHIRAMSKCASERRIAGLMLWYYDRGRLGTLLALLPYVILVAAVCRDIGLKNIAADAVLSVLGAFNRSETGGLSD